jgi:hypothetical protein
MALISQLANTSVTLERTLGMPAEGPKALPIALDFSANSTYVLDYTNMQQRNYFGLVQTLWVDNFGNGSTLIITIPAVAQRIVVPAGVQGYFTCICPNPIKMQFDSAGGTVQQVTLLNFPILG